MKTEQVDVLVIGAGPSGTVAASIINKAGFKVKIVEKDEISPFCNWRKSIAPLHGSIGGSGISWMR